MNIVEFHHVDLGYKGRRFNLRENYILKNINLKIRSNSSVFLQGDNGSGKTTLAKAILGLMQPLNGVIKRENVKMAYVPQRNSIHLEYPLSIEDLVKSGIRVKNSIAWLWQKYVRHSQTNDAYGNLLQGLKIDDIKHKRISEVSGGQLQRALIARALIDSPQFIIFDEPFANLDKKRQKEIAEEIVKIKAQRQVAVLIIDHHQVIAPEFFTNLYELRQESLSEVKKIKILPQKPVAKKKRKEK